MKKLRLLTAAAFLFVLSMNIFAAEVGPDGSFNHSIDITLPPGTAGLTPKLSLSYNSNSGNGIIGQGWSLEGLPFITRDPNRGINYTATDTYTGYNGTLISQGNGIYHFEYENFSKIEMHGSAANPDYWVETRADGTKYYYGAYDGSKNAMSANVEAVGKNLIRVWALSKVEDTNGNFYTVEYREDSGEFYPARIVYTQRSNASPRLRVIDFEYDESSRKDYCTQYTYSAPVTTKWRLKSITVKVNVPQFFNYPITILGDLVRSYDLVYEGGESGIDVSRIVNINVLGAGGELTDNTIITWSNKQSQTNDNFTTISYLPWGGYQTAVGRWLIGDIHGYGKTDLLHITGNDYIHTWTSNGNGTYTVGTYQPSSGYQTALGRWQSGDVNGDGKVDLIHITGRDYIHTWISNGNGTFTLGTFQPWGGYQTALGSWQSGDISGDGMMDFIHIVGSNYINSWVSNGNGTFSVSTYCPSGTYNTGVGAWQSCEINGDGKTDFLHIIGNTINSWISNGNGTFTLKSSTLSSDYIPNTGSEKWQYGDLNGDGKTDLIYIRKDSYVTVLISKGDGTFIANKFNPRSGYETGVGSWQSGDINGDGKSDIIHLIGNDYINIWLSNGDGTFMVVPYQPWSGYQSFRGSWQSGDINGDGKSDIIHITGNDYINTLCAKTDEKHIVGLKTVSGAKIDVFYNSAVELGVMEPAQSIYHNIANATPRQLVTSITTSDGRGGIYTKNYTYTDGRFYNGYLYERRDLGFAKITETDSGTGITKETSYNNTNRWLAMSPTDVVIYGNSGNIQTQTFVYADVIANGTHFARLDSSSTTVYEGGSPLYTKTANNTYDPNYGNITNTSGYDGTNNFSVDITYSVDADKWILNRPATVKKTSGGITVQDDAYTYDGNKNLLSARNILSQAITYSYDECGNIISITNPLGNVTSITYDSDYKTFPEEITNAAGITVKRKYDAAFGNVVSQTDPGENRTDYEYDGQGRLIEETNPDGDIVREVDYHDELLGNPSSQYVETKVYNGGSVAATTTKEYFDALGRVYKRTSDVGSLSGETLTRVEEFTFGAAGELTTKTIPYISGKQNSADMLITYEYDSSYRRVVKEKRPDCTISYSYSVESGLLVVETTDPKGKTYTSKYNSRGQLVKKDDPLSAGITYTYDGAGRLTRTVDAKSNVTLITYDALGNRTTISDPNTGTTYYTYDNGNRLESKTDSRGVTVSYTYDNADRVTKAHYSDDTPEVTYSYDDTSMVNGKGRLTSVSDGVSTTKFGYDSRGNTSYIRQSVDRLDFVARFEYDIQNRQSALIYPDGTRIDNVYSQGGALQAVKCGTGAFVQYGLSFDGTGDNKNAVKRYTGDGVETTIVFDPVNNRAKAVTSKNKDNETLEDNSYSHDSNGNILSITDKVNTGASQTFTYDDLNRLTKAHGIYGIHDYSYDNVGNLTSNNHGSLTYSDSAHPFAVTADGDGNSYSYDNAGNMTYRKGATLAYDGENRLKSITGSTKDQEYSYDYSGHRVIKKEKDGYTTYNFMGIYEVAQALNKNDVHTKYIYGLKGDIVAQVTTENATLVTAMNSGGVYDRAYASIGAVAFILRGKIAADEFISKPENIQLIQKILIAIAALSLLSLAVYLRIYWRFETPLFRWSADFSPALLAVLVITFSFTGCDIITGTSATTGLPTGGTYYFHPDHVGSVSYLTDAAGKIVTRMYYTPYGEKVTSAITGPDIFHKKYTGQEDDGTGLLYYKARYYDPAIGRFISADSVVPDPWYSQAFNRYMYGYGNPVRYCDPSGNSISEGASDAGHAIGNAGGGSAGSVGSGLGHGGGNDGSVNNNSSRLPSHTDNTNGRYGSNICICSAGSQLAASNGHGNSGEVTLAVYDGTTLPVSSDDFHGVTDEPGSFQKFRNRTHTGFDIKANKGTSVYSVIVGQVIFAGKQRGYGNLIIIEDKNGYQYLVAHLNDIFVEIGQPVTKGELIGLSGATGNVTGPHIHFEILNEMGNPIDPCTGKEIDINYHNIFNLGVTRVDFVLPYIIRKK